MHTSVQESQGSDFKTLIPQAELSRPFQSDHALDLGYNTQPPQREKLQPFNVRIVWSQTLPCLVSVSFGEMIPL